MVVFGYLLAGIFSVLSGIHVYWAFGGKRGLTAAIPTKDGNPLFEAGPGGTLAVAVALLVAGGIVLGRIDVFVLASMPAWVYQWGVWAIAVLFFLRAIGEFRYAGFFKSVKDTNFAYWDTRLFSPLCLFVSGSALLISILG